MTGQDSLSSNENLPIDVPETGDGHSCLDCYTSQPCVLFCHLIELSATDRVILGGHPLTRTSKRLTARCLGLGFVCWPRRRSKTAARDSPWARE